MAKSSVSTIDIINQVIETCDVEVDDCDVNLDVGVDVGIDIDFNIDRSGNEEIRTTPFTSSPLQSAPEDPRLKSPASEITKTFKTITSTGSSYSSNLDANRSHIRLKMSSSALHPKGHLSSMKIPPLLHQLPTLPCFLGSSSSSKNSPLSFSSSTFDGLNSIASTSSIANFALNLVEKDYVFEDSKKENEDNDEAKHQDQCLTVNQEESAPTALQPASNQAQAQEKPPSSPSSQEEKEQEQEQVQIVENDQTQVGATKTPIDLDSIDLDNIKVDELYGLQVADGDTLRAKYLNKLSHCEREHVLQDIHGVADLMEERIDEEFIEESLKKLQTDINNELVLRKVQKKNKSSKDVQEQPRQQMDPPVTISAAPKTPGFEELSLLPPNTNAGTDSLPQKPLLAKNHHLFGKLKGDSDRFFFRPSNVTTKNKSNARHMPFLSSGLTPSIFSPKTAMASSSSSSPTASVSTSHEAQQDILILNSKDATAYEQALAQCRRRRRERNYSLFCPGMKSDTDNDDPNVDQYIDVEQRDFRLSFLRAGRYDTMNTAKGFLDYFEEKKRLFGINYLTKKIQLKNLDAETKDCLESGQIQLLPGRDRAGRAVIVLTKKLATNSKPRNDENSILRAFWMLCSIALEDEETKTKGVVLVYYTIGGANSCSEKRRGIAGHRHQVRQWGNILHALPLRVASIHWCVENSALKQAANLSALMLGGSNFARVRCHAGADIDVQYNLMTFGIPTDLFPVSKSGKVNLSHHTEFLRKRKQIESTAFLDKALALIAAPLLDDCIPLNISGDEHQEDAETVIEPPLSASAEINPFSTPPLFPIEIRSHQINRSINFRLPQQQQFEKNRISDDLSYSNNNIVQSTSFNDSLCLTGNHNPVQVQPPLQHQYQQQLGMGMNMDIEVGMAQQYQQQQQGIISSSKSGIRFSTEPVLVPCELDILLGRGRGAQNHKGNIHYRNVVEAFRSRYEQIPQKGAKTQLIREVVAVIYDNGGRFLKQDGFGRYIPVDPEVARDKVSHSFRNQKRLSEGGSSSGEQSRKRCRDE